MGCFANIVPIAYDIDIEILPSDCTRSEKKLLLGHRNQEIPFEMIVSQTKPVRDSAINSIFQVAFTLEPDIDLNLIGLDVQKIDIYRGAPQLDIFSMFRKNGNAFVGRFEYNSDLFLNETVNDFAENFHSFIMEAIENHSKKISSLKIFDHINSIDRRKPGLEKKDIGNGCRAEA